MNLNMRFQEALGMVGSRMRKTKFLNFLSVTAQEWHITFICISLTKANPSAMHNLKGECSSKEKRIRDLWENDTYHSLSFLITKYSATLLLTYRKHP